MASSSGLRGSPNVHESRDHNGSSNKMISKDELPLFKTMAWFTDAIIAPLNLAEEYGIEVRMVVHSVYNLTLHCQRIVNLIVQKEATLFTGDQSNAFYEAMLSSDESVSKLARQHKPTNVEKSQATRSLLLYRLVDTIAFVKGHKTTSQSNESVKRRPFQMLPIPVRYFFQYSKFPNQF